MKFKNKKILSCVLAGALAFASVASLCACQNTGGNTGDNPNGKPNGDENTPTFVGGDYVKAPTGKPDYSAHAEEKMPIGAWSTTPRINYEYTAEELAAAKEAGIDFFCDMRISRYTSTRTAIKCFEAIRDAGMKTFINLSGYDYDDLCKAGHLDENGDIMTEDGVHGGVYDLLGEDYILGFNLWDEPNTERFASLDKRGAMFLKDFPEKQCYINLLPNYATNGQLHAGTYQEYISTFAETVTNVTHYSYDFYPLVGQMSGEEVTSHALNPLWLVSLEVNANAAKETGNDLWVFIQNMSFGVNNRAPQSKSDITLQNYVNMCYGARGIQYFSFQTPDTNEFGPDDVGMLDRDLNKTKNFDYVKEANEELATFDHVYLQFEWENVMPVTGTVFEDISCSGFDLLSSHMTSSEYFSATANVDTLIGQFHDANGYKGYMVANMSDPLEYYTDRVSMTFNANRVLVYGNGSSEVVKIPTGVYTFNLQEGEGRFLIPFNV